MSINIFIALVLGLLMGMYLSFSPTYRDEGERGEIPQIELHSFTLYEISSRGIDHVLEGAEGKKFDNRYEITSAKFGDNTKSMYQSIAAGSVHYRDDLVRLKTDVLYRREDGLEFRSAEGEYNTTLYYNTQERTLSADAVKGSYELK